MERKLVRKGFWEGPGRKILRVLALSVLIAVLCAGWTWDKAHAKSTKTASYYMCFNVGDWWPHVRIYQLYDNGYTVLKYDGAYSGGCPF